MAEHPVLEVQEQLAQADVDLTEAEVYQVGRFLTSMAETSGKKVSLFIGRAWLRVPAGGGYLEGGVTNHHPKFQEEPT